MLVRAKECSVVETLGCLAGNCSGDEEAEVGDAGLRKCWRKLGLRNRSGAEGKGRRGAESRCISFPV